jgi:DNA-binding NarL/FixJ family response regulator
MLRPVARRCLIVDDNGEFLQTARGLLERQGMNIVGVASTGAEGVALAAELSPELVLVDVDLGEESGFDVARALAAADEPARVILISAYAEKDLESLLEASPAAGFLSKSVLSRRAIDELLDGKRNA